MKLTGRKSKFAKRIQKTRQAVIVGAALGLLLAFLFHPMYFVGATGVATVLLTIAAVFTAKRWDRANATMPTIAEWNTRAAALQEKEDKAKGKTTEEATG